MVRDVNMSLTETNEKEDKILKSEFNKYLYKKTDIKTKMFLGKSL